MLVVDHYRLLSTTLPVTESHVCAVVYLHAILWLEFMNVHMFSSSSCHIIGLAERSRLVLMPKMRAYPSLRHGIVSEVPL